MADQQRMGPVRGVDEPTLDPVRAAAIDHGLRRVLIVVDEPIPDERDAGRGQERADDLGYDVAGNLRPRETTTPREGQRHSGVQVRPGHSPARVDGERDRESPEESRPEQPGQEAVLATGYGIGDEAVAQKN